MKRLLILFLACTFIVSCKTTQRVLSPPDFTYLNFSKVKLKVGSSSFGSYSLKGFINFIKDTSVCFKFYGPLSIEALEGRFDKTLDIKDVYNDRIFTDLLATIYEKDGIRIGLKDVQNLFFGNVSGFLDSIMNSNLHSLSIEKESNLSRFTLVSKGSKATYTFKIKKRQLYIDELVIDYTNGRDLMTIDFKVLAFNNERRKCNVRF